MANLIRGARSIAAGAISYLTGRPTLPYSNGVPADPAEATDDLIRQQVWGTKYQPSGGNLTNETPQVRARYREMLREPMVKVGILSKVWDVASQTIAFDPVDKNNPRDVEVAEFNTANIENATGGVLAVVESILFGTLIDGFGVCHKKKRDEDRGRWAGKRVLAELRPKDSDYYWLDYDDFRNLRAVVAKYPAADDPSQGRYDPADFVVTYHVRIFDAPWGMSDFRAADRAYCCLDAATKLRMVYLDKYAGPFVHATYTDKAIETRLLEQLKKMRAGGVAVVPKGTELVITETAMSGAEAFARATADWREEIVVSMTFGYLQMLGGQVPSGSGRSSEHAQSAKVARWYLSQLVCNAVGDQIGHDATDENFAGTPPYPRATASGVDPDFVVKDLETAALMLDMGLGLDEDEIHERGGWRRGEYRKAAPVVLPPTEAAISAGLAAKPGGAPPVPPKVPSDAAPVPTGVGGGK